MGLLVQPPRMGGNGTLLFLPSCQFNGGWAKVGRLLRSCRAGGEVVGYGMFGSPRDDNLWSGSGHSSLEMCISPDAMQGFVPFWAVIVRKIV